MINRGGAFESSWRSENMRPTHTLLPSSTSSSSLLLPSSNIQFMTPSWIESQEFPHESWRQLLMGGMAEEENKYNSTPFQTKKMENWEDPTLGLHNIIDVKQDLGDKAYFYRQETEEIQAPKSSWSHILQNSSPRSCVTTSFNSNMLDFSNSMAETKIQLSSQECNSTSTGSPYKKARVQASSVQSTFKVRKEKLGDRISALHQLVSPFGKTDTASVLLEVIGYIRFLQSQIEALSSPYLASGSNNMIKQQPVQGEMNTCIFPEDPGQLLNDNGLHRMGAPDQDGIAHDQPKKDLRSRGLCLVPVSFTMHVGSENGADFWAPTFGGGFR